MQESYVAPLPIAPAARADNRCSLRMKGVYVSHHGVSISVSSRLQPDDCMKIAIDMLHRNPRPHHPPPSTLHAPSKTSTHSFPLHLHASKHLALDVGRRYPRVAFAPSVM